MGVALSLHLLAVVIWVGGLFFAFMFLKPSAAAVLSLEQRLPLWENVFNRFFPWIWGCIAVIVITGAKMLFLLGGMGNVGLHVHIMLLLGIFMILLFMHVFFNPYRKLKKANHEHDWVAGSKALDNIRKFVRANMLIGLSLVIIGTAGKFL